jgi:DNA helicase IV
VRGDGGPPVWHTVSPDALATSIATVVAAVKHRHRLTGIVAQPGDHAAITTALAAAGLVAVDHVHQLGHDDVPLFGPEEVKGLEFDGVVVVNPHDILGDDPRGARLLYVAMTRAVQELAFVTTAPAPTVLSASGGA